MFMSIYWSEKARLLQPYTPGEQPKFTNLVKLNTNENPFEPSPRVMEAMHDAIDGDLRLYPDPEANRLKQTISDYYHLSSSQVFVGNGSDEVLALAFATFFQCKNNLLLPEISYSFYPVYCQLYDVQAQLIPLDNDLAINPEDYQYAQGGVVIANPNAPTGRLLSLEQIEQIVQANPAGVVLVDEAYIDFGGQSAVKLIARYPNLLIIQTLSKSRSLAGLRVGLALGQSELIAGMQKVKNSFNSYPLDRVAQAGAIAAFNDEAYFRQTCKQVVENRQWLAEQLEALDFNVLPSAANFVFASHASYAAELIYQRLHQLGIIVRHFKQLRINNYLRISVGTMKQQQQLIAALKTILI